MLINAQLRRNDNDSFDSQTHRLDKFANEPTNRMLTIKVLTK